MVKPSQLTKKPSGVKYNIQQLRDVNSDAVNAVIVGDHSGIHHTVRIRPGCVISAYSTIDADCRLESSVGAFVHLNRNCRIGRAAHIGLLYSEYKNIPTDTNATIIIGSNSRIENAARIYPHTILMDSVVVEKQAKIGKLSIDQTETVATTEIDRSCHIGKGALIMSGVKLGENIEVEPYTIIPSVLSNNFMNKRNISITPELIQQTLPDKHPAKYHYHDLVAAHKKSLR